MEIDVHNPNSCSTPDEISGSAAPVMQANYANTLSIASMGSPFAVSEPIPYKMDSLNQPYGYLMQGSNGKLTLAVQGPASTSYSHKFAINGTIPSGNMGIVTRPTPIMTGSNENP